MPCEIASPQLAHHLHNAFNLGLRIDVIGSKTPLHRCGKIENRADFER